MKKSKTSIISVTGKGLIETEANILEIRIEIYKTTDSLNQSQKEVNQVVNNIINILKQNNINEKDIHTTSVKFMPNYTWKDNSIEYTGQKVEQNLVCFIGDIKNNIEKAVNILDSITINNNSIDLDLRFGIKESGDMVLKCRELAYQDGFKKAKKYAELAGLKIIKAVRISEDNESSLFYNRDDRSFYACCEIGSPPTKLPMGKVEKSMELQIDFIAE